jgi:hypothetical protein
MIRTRRQRLERIADQLLNQAAKLEATINTLPPDLRDATRLKWELSGLITRVREAAKRP